MSDALTVTWHGTGRRPQCAPNPDFPDGVDFDATFGLPGPSCRADLPYPAPSIGHHVVRCPVCGASIAITAASRPDDPRSIKILCKVKGAA